SGATITREDLQLNPPPCHAVDAPPPGQLPLQEYLDQAERQAIQEALQKTRYNRTAAARLLGVTFRSLRYRMERLGLKD
ncbi:partial Regulatory protein AtoC, partial [Rhodocyclaceae bacterium]